MDSALKVRHIYEHDSDDFELAINRAIAAILAADGVVGDIQYVNDPATDQNHRGGFGALIIYETEEATRE